MRPKYQTLRDESLTHQVVFAVINGGSVVTISCNCRGVKNKQGLVHYEPISSTTTLEQSRRLYNDPASHRVSFAEGDIAKW